MVVSAGRDIRTVSFSPRVRRSGAGIPARMGRRSALGVSMVTGMGMAVGALSAVIGVTVRRGASEKQPRGSGRPVNRYVVRA